MTNLELGSTVSVDGWMDIRVVSYDMHCRGAEYDLRITQRFVFQPLVGMGFAFQEIPKRNLGRGLTHISLDLRMRYEVKREFVPYLGVRSSRLFGETRNIAKAGGEGISPFFLITGFRFAL